MPTLSLHGLLPAAQAVAAGDRIDAGRPQWCDHVEPFLQLFDGQILAARRLGPLQSSQRLAGAGAFGLDKALRAPPDAQEARRRRIEAFEQIAKDAAAGAWSVRPLDAHGQAEPIDPGCIGDQAMNGSSAASGPMHEEVDVQAAAARALQDPDGVVGAPKPREPMPQALEHSCQIDRGLTVAVQAKRDEGVERPPHHLGELEGAGEFDCLPAGQVRVAGPSSAPAAGRIVGPARWTSFAELTYGLPHAAIGRGMARRDAVGLAGARQYQGFG
jgi:hypothetical protein